MQQGHCRGMEHSSPMPLTYVTENHGRWLSVVVGGESRYLIRWYKRSERAGQTDLNVVCRHGGSEKEEDEKRCSTHRPTSRLELPYRHLPLEESSLVL